MHETALILLLLSTLVSLSHFFQVKLGPRKDEQDELRSHNALCKQE
jgi:hypothetical protein